MDVKDISRVAASDGKAKEAKASRQRSMRSLSKSLNDVAPGAAVRVEGQNVAPKDKSELRGRLNAAISFQNVTSEATGKIAELVKSIEGIVEQASADPSAKEKLAKLETEGNGLLDEIKRIAKDTKVEGLRPLAGDEIRIEVEAKIGKILRTILPDDAKEAFGVSGLNFSTVDSIIGTRAAVAKAQQRFEELQKAVEKTSGTIQELTQTLEVAFQNSESADTSIRDLDEALKIAGQTRTVIAQEPTQALNSVGSINQKVLDLLNQ